MFQGTDNYNEILTTYAQGAHANPDGAVDVCRLIFPAVAVDEAVGTYDKWTLDPSFTPVDTGLARNQSAHRINIDRRQETFNCTPHALEIAHWTPALMQKSGPRYREAGVRTLMSSQFISRQSTAVDILKNEVAEDTTLAITAAADPIVQIDKLCEKVAGSVVGRMPKTIIMGRNAWNFIKNHEEVKKRCHGLNYAIKPEQLKDALAYNGINLVISDLYVMKKGVMVPLLGYDVVALYNEEAPGLSDLSFGKEFTLSPAGPEVLSWKDNALYDVDTLVWSSDRKVTNSAAAARLTVNVA